LSPPPPESPSCPRSRTSAQASSLRCGRLATTLAPPADTRAHTARAHAHAKQPRARAGGSFKHALPRTTHAATARHARRALPPAQLRLVARNSLLGGGGAAVLLYPEIVFRAAPYVSRGVTKAEDTIASVRAN